MEVDIVTGQGQWRSPWWLYNVMIIIKCNYNIWWHIVTLCVMTRNETWFEYEMSSRVRRLQVFATTYSSSFVATCWARSSWSSSPSSWSSWSSSWNVPQKLTERPLPPFYGRNFPQKLRSPACRACSGKNTQKGKIDWDWCLRMAITITIPIEMTVTMVMTRGNGIGNA